MPRVKPRFAEEQVVVAVRDFAHDRGVVKAGTKLRAKDPLVRSAYTESLTYVFYL